jgi:hypothetical protein
MSKAIEIADRLEDSSFTLYGDPQTERAAAAELRRLAFVNASLLKALKLLIEAPTFETYRKKARAAIKKATS